MRLERVVVAYPSGNTTAIILGQPTGYDQKNINDRILCAWRSQYPNQPEIEQCCIVTQPQDPDVIARVDMLGGEFCGNATRSAIWLLTGGLRRTGLVEVSGVDRPLIFSVRDKEVILEMPLPRAGELVRRVDEGLLVQLEGIAQLVTSPRSDQTPRQLLGTLLKDDKYQLTKQPAVGISAYDKETKQATFCVWVRDIDTMFDETACGSGTSAIGVAQAWETGQAIALDVVQPSGETIRTEATVKPGMVDASFITGSVSILYDGPLELA
jgi:diaminopimelate epimerase